MERLDPCRRDEIEKRLRRDSAGADWEGRTTRLGCSYLTDKFKILQAEPNVGEALTADSKELNLLRRKLAHSDDYAWDVDEPLENFCKRYQLAQDWVKTFNKLLANEEKTHGQPSFPPTGAHVDPLPKPPSGNSASSASG